MARNWVDVSFDLECERCGKGLNASIDILKITVEPCPDCLAEEREKGRDEERSE